MKKKISSSICFSLSYLFLGYSQATSNVIVVSQPGFQLCQQFRETPVRIICPSCRADVLTSTHYEAGTFTWVACLIIAFIGYVFLYLNTQLLGSQRFADRQQLSSTFVWQNPTCYYGNAQPLTTTFICFQLHTTPCTSNNAGSR